MSEKCRSKFATSITSNCTDAEWNRRENRCAPLVMRHKHHCPHAARASLQTTV